MFKATRGKALIINVKKVCNDIERQGTDIDRDNLEKLWTSLQFNITVYNDEDGLAAHVSTVTDYSGGGGNKEGY